MLLSDAMKLEEETIIHKTIETVGAIITTIHNIKGTNQVMLNINPWAIPFLIYYGVGVGGTRYSKGLALGLRGNYTKRLYKIICSQRDRKQYYYPILQLCIHERKEGNSTNNIHLFTGGSVMQWITLQIIKQ